MGEINVCSQLPTISDADLLAAYQASRGGAAFAALLARHGPWVLRFCRRRLGRYQDAEDVCQAIFLALARQPERVQLSVSGWLYCAAVRAVKDWRRGAARRARREGMVALARQPDVHNRTAVLRDEVTAALRRLPTRLRQAVALRYLEGLNQREAALRLGCPQGTIATRAREGLLRLRATLSSNATAAAIAGRG
jgi:RNA polymerase sigma factor (sigma-70 family)